MDYETLGHTLIEFIPPKDFIELYQGDYENMRAEMIYVKTDDFDQLLEKLKILKGRIRLKMENLNLNQIIALTRRDLQDASMRKPEAIDMYIPVRIANDAAKGEEDIKKAVIYNVHFRKMGKGFIFENIEIQHMT